MSKSGFPVLIAACLLLFTSAPAQAYPSLSKKQDDKAKTRWSFSDAIAQREHIRLMDLWLAFHTPSPFEFYLGGYYLFGKSTALDHYSGANVFLAAYASLFGIEVQGETTQLDPRLIGIFHLRLFGFHSQGTHITPQAGGKYTSRGGDFDWNLFAGVTLALYLHRYFGIEGLYRHYFPSQNGTGFYGNRYEADAFIDFRFFRVFGGFFYELEARPNDTNEIVSGGLSGVKLFF